jgi:hypothetical protein
MPGPNSFASVVIGDCFVLPALNAIIISFYKTWESKPLADDARVVPFIGGGAQSGLAVLIAIVAGFLTYASWLTTNKTDWTIPKPGTLNGAGLYHVVFLVTEVYFITNFILSAGRIAVIKLRTPDQGSLGSISRRQRAVALLPLIRLLGCAALVSDVFAFSLLIDGLRNVVPLTNYIGAASTEVACIVVALLVIIFGLYRINLLVLLRDVVAPLLLVAALAGATVPLVLVLLA